MSHIITIPSCRFAVCSSSDRDDVVTEVADTDTDYEDMDDEDRDKETTALTYTQKNTENSNRRSIVIRGLCLIAFILMFPIYIYSERINLYLSDIAFVQNNNVSLPTASILVPDITCDLARFGCCPYDEAIKHNPQGSNCKSYEEVLHMLKIERLKSEVVIFIIFAIICYCILQVFCPS